MSQIRIPLFGGASLLLDWEPGEMVAGLAERLQDRTPFWGRVGSIMRRSFAANFQAGGRPAWKPLQPATIRKKEGAGLPARTPSGRIPSRLKQRGQFGPQNTLIETGALRDSWARKGARGHVERVEGDSFVIGSQLTITRQLSPAKPLRHYHLLTKKSAKARAKGSSVPALIPLARIHEEGAPNARIPARQVGVVQDEDLAAIEAAGIGWVTGDWNSAAGD